MTATLLSLVLLCPLPQAQAKAPDLSTPEKAAKAWVDFWYGQRARPNHYAETRGKAERLLLPALTPEAATKHMALVGKLAKKIQGRHRTRAWATKVAAIEDADGGREVTLEITETYDRTIKGKVERLTRTSPHKYVLRQVGKTWRLKARFDPCSGCKAKGKCLTCRGKGRRGARRACFRCAGKGTCKRCEGTGFREDDLTGIALGFIAPSTQLEVKLDLSTAQKAAEAWIQLQRKKELVGDQAVGARFRRLIDGMRPFLTPELVKRIDAKQAKGQAVSTRLFQKRCAQLKSLEQEPDGTARAVIAAPHPYDREPDKQPDLVFSRLVLKKTGAAWRVDSIQDACVPCARKGKCPECTAGKTPRGPCQVCNGTDTCSYCKGAGWKPPRPTFSD